MPAESSQYNARHIFVEGSNETTDNSPRKDFLSIDHLKWAIRLLFVYFGFRLIYIALNISPFVPPDEVTHAGLCKIFATVLLFPENSPTSYKFGLVTNIPWFYYWSMGKMLHLNLFGIPDLVYLRLINIPFAIGTVWYAIRTLRLLTNDRLTQILLVVVLTNTAMFSLLSAAVSSDNLTNLFAAMAIYYLFAFFRERSEKFLTASFLCQLAGCLTKVTFMPLVLVLVLLLLFHEFRNLGNLPATVKSCFQRSRRLTLASALAILVAAGLNLHLYAGNYLSYGTLQPGMAEVFPKNAMQYRITARESIFSRYREEKITFMEALQLTGDIEHPGDKADTFYILMNYEKLKLNPNLWMEPLQYARVWFTDIAGSVFGIKGHLHMFKPTGYLIPVYAVMALSSLGFAFRCRPRLSGWLPPCLAAVACCYTGYIFYKVNYNAYLHYGTPGVTLHGRYLFPVIGPIYVLLCHYLLQLFRNEKINLLLALATALLFIAYDFPWFLMHDSPKWYEWMPR